ENNWRERIGWLLHDRNVGLLVLCGIIFRIIIFLLHPDLILVPDSRSFWDLAGLLGHFDIAGYSGQRSPGYPLLLCFTFGYLPVVILLQFGIGILSSVIWYKT